MKVNYDWLTALCLICLFLCDFVPVTSVIILSKRPAKDEKTTFPYEHAMEDKLMCG